MKHLTKQQTKYYEFNKLFYEDIIQDIKNAKKSIRIETYKIEGKIIERIRDELIIKAREGVKIQLLIDHWGSCVKKSFFQDLVLLGAEVIFFKKLKLTINFFAYNNKRNHRKIILIDDEITYLGSSNITDYSLTWKEFNIRIEDDSFGKKIREIFLDSLKIHNKFFHSVKKHVRPIKFETLEIVRDVPSLIFQKIRNKHLHLIRNAKKQIIIETPYFVPDFKMIKTLIYAAKRGVDISLIIPKSSDVTVVDVFTQSLFGLLHKRGVKIMFFGPEFNHSKLTLIDDDVFSFGSANFDYRSFRYQYELTVFGRNNIIRDYIKNHLVESLKKTEPFDYKKWKERPLYKRILEILIDPFKHYL